MPPPKGYKLDTPSNIPEGYTLDAPTPQPVASHTQARTPGNYAGAVGGGLAEGAKDFVSGTYGTLRHPIETGKSLAKQLDEFFQTPEDEASWQGNLLKAAEKFPVVGGYVQQAETGGTTPGSPEALRAGVRASTALAVGPKTAELIAKAGPRAITESAKSGLRKVTGTTPKVVKSHVAEVEKANLEAQGKHGAELEKSKSEFKKNVQKHVEEKAKVEAARAEGKRKFETESAKQKKIKETEAKREEAHRNLQAGIETARENARKIGNEKYDAVNERLKNQPAEPSKLVTAVQNSMSEIKGTDVKPQIFKSIEDRLMNENGVSYQDLQGYYSELGKELMRGTLDGYLYHAYDSLHEAIGNEMQRIADNNGMGAELTDARNYWRRMKQTFGKSHITTDEATEALRTSDPTRYAETIRKKRINLQGSFDPRLPGLYQHVENLKTGAESLPKPVPQRALTAELMESQKAAPKPPKPNYPTAPEPQKVHKADVEIAKRDALQEDAGWLDKQAVSAAKYMILLRGAYDAIHKTVNVPGDISAGVLTYAGMRAIADTLRNPKVVEMLGKMTEQDLAEIPEEMRGEDLKNIVFEARKQGIKVSPALLAAVGAAGNRPEGDKTKKLREIQNAQ